MAKKNETPEQDPRKGLTLDQVIGNQPARDFLNKSWRNGRLPHALLFCGPSGVGKTTMAWALARQIAAEDGDPATHPRALKIQRNVHPDMIELDITQSGGNMIRVDDVRGLEDRVYTAPLEAGRKIVLIKPAERMNESAANCLLKILEEPPGHLLFLLISDEPNQLLDTIRSRCTPVMLEPVGTEELAAWLSSQHKIESQKAHLIAALSEGCPGQALVLAKAGMLQQRGQVLDTLTHLMTHGFAAIFAVSERICAVGGDLGEAFTVTLTLLRDALVLKMRGEGILNTDLREKLESFAAGYSAQGLLEAAELLESAIGQTPYLYSPAAQLHFTEVTMAEVGRLLKQ